MWNQQFCTYVDILLLPLETIPEDEDDARIPLRLHRLVLSLVRVVLAANNERLLPSTWNHTLRALLAVQNLVMAGKPRYSSKTIDSLIGMLVKTIYVTWARANTNDHEIWEQLCAAMQRHILWPQVVRQWGKMVLKMTRVIIKEVYGIDTKKLGQDVMLPKLLRKKKNALQPAAAAAASRSLRKHHSANPITIMTGGNRHDESYGTTITGASNSNNTVGMSDEESPRIERKRSQTHNALDRLVNVTRNTSIQQLEVTFADFKTEGFTELSSVKWTPDYALRSWKNILCSLGNPNTIENPGFHLEAIDCLVDTWSMLAAVQRRQSIGGGYQPALSNLCHGYSKQPICQSSRAAAYGCICRMMGTKLDEPVPRELCVHFYRLILKGVAIKDDRIRTSIMWRSANLFRNCLPGSTVLLPSYLMCFRTMLLEDGKTKMRQIPKEIRIATAKTLCSMICLPNRFISLKVPIVTYNQLLKRLQATIRKIRLNRLVVHQAHFITLLSDLLTAASSQPVAQYDGELHSILVYTMLVILLDDLATETPNTNMIRRCLATLLSHLYLKSTEPAIAAITALSVFLHDPARLAALGDKLIIQIITDIVGALGEQLKTRPRDKTRAQLSEHVLHHLSSVIFDTIDLATQELSSWYESATTPTVEPALQFGDLNRPVRRSSIQLLRGRRSHSGGAGSVGSTDQFDTEVVHTPTQVTLSNATGATTIISNPTAGTNSASAGSASTSAAASGSTAVAAGSSHQQHQSPQHTSNTTSATSSTLASNASNTHSSPSIPAHDGWTIVQESAESALLHLLHHFNGFPPRHGADMVHSLLKESINHESSEESYDNSLLLMYNGNTIVSFCMDPSNPHVIRVILRNPTGKYVWDIQTVEAIHESDEVDVTTSTTNTTNPIAVTAASEASNSTTSLASSTTIAITPMDSMVLDKRYLTNSTTATTGEASKNPSYAIDSCIPPDPLASLLDRIESTSTYNSSLKRHSQLRHNIQCESATAITCTPPLNSRISTNTLHNQPEQPLPPLPGSGHDALLERVMEAVEGDKICQLKITPSLIRDVKELDQVIKIGLLYVAPGQDTERAILGNHSASAMYDQFVSTLGWEIDLRNHGGYRGRLDCEENYHTAIYYANSTIEMLFHDATRLPTNPNDPQQVKKKRHIGNDHVHIVWNEHRRDYRPDTIGGDFGNIQIVVTPVPNGLFAIDIFRDQRLDLPGPLVDGMMVPWSILGPLVRVTAIHAFRLCVNRLQARNPKPAVQRLKDLKVIYNRHRESQTSYVDFLSRLLSTVDRQPH
ncbi:hypothetical protein BDF22DRAFT_745751 [Syncephalis plumigaleata]|nr:hypothetical protein BDF22DRAFT_745751 [Syncephalis plumigaleata]